MDDWGDRSAFHFTKQKTVLPLNPPRRVWTSWSNDDDGGIFAGEAIAIIVHLDSFAVSQDPKRIERRAHSGRAYLEYALPDDYDNGETPTNTDEYCVDGYLIIFDDFDDSEWGGPVHYHKSSGVFGTQENAEKDVAGDIALYKRQQEKKAAEATKGTKAEAGTEATSSAADPIIP